MNDAQKKFWKTFAINGFVIFVGVTAIMAGSDLYDVKKEQKIKASKTTT